MNEQIIANPTIQDHLNGAPEEIVDLFKILQKKIFDLDQVEEQPKSQYIGYYYMLNKNDPKLFVEVHIQKRKKRIVLHIRPCDYYDPDNKVFLYTYIPKWPLRSGFVISTTKDLNYSIPLIKASYKDVS